MENITKDLRNIINISDITHNPTRIKGILRDIFPNEKRKINILSSMLDCGIVKQISQSQAIGETELWKYINCLETEYGTKEIYAYEGVRQWADICEVPCVSLSFKVESVNCDIENESVLYTEVKHERVKRKSKELEKNYIFQLNDIILDNTDLQLQYMGIKDNEILFYATNKGNNDLWLINLEVEVDGTSMLCSGFCPLNPKEKILINYSLPYSIRSTINIVFRYEVFNGTYNTAHEKEAKKTSVIKLQPYYL